MRNTTTLRATGAWLAWWGVFVLCYLLLVARASLAEVVAGAVGAALAATAVLVTKQTAELNFRPRLSWLAHLQRLPWRVLADCGIVLAALWRRLVLRQSVRGSFRVIPFDPGGEDAVSAARRALVVAGVSLAPNTYVIDMDAKRRLLLVHQLVPTPQPPGNGDREWPL